jgi:hypothetical protein
VPLLQAPFEVVDYTTPPTQRATSRPPASRGATPDERLLEPSSGRGHRQGIELIELSPIGEAPSRPGNRDSPLRARSVASPVLARGFSRVTDDRCKVLI